MFGNILIATALSFAVGIGVVNTPETNYNNDIPNNVVYDDENYSITLSVDELNNYTWENLSNLYNNDDHTYITYVVYNNSTKSNTSQADGIVNFSGIRFYYDSTELEDTNWVNKFSNGVEGSNGIFEYNLELSINTSYYNTVKQAIELDIQENAPAQSSMGNTIIDAIKSGLGLIGELASQFLLGFSTLFWANNALTPFATFALIMLGIAITMAVVSLVLRIIRGNTGA